MTSKSCLLGILICIALLALLFGIDGLSRDVRNRRQHKETNKYKTEANCTILSATSRRSRTTGGRTCHYTHYLLEYVIDLDRVVDGTTYLGYPLADYVGVRQSYSNFYEHTCGGEVNLKPNTSTALPCWFEFPSDTRVRISSVFDRTYTFLIYGTILIVGGGLPVISFIFYNCFLCVYACTREPPEERTPPPRQAAPVQPEEPRRTEPFEIRDVDTDEGWRDRFTHNSYARSIITRVQRIRHRQIVDDSSAPASPTMIGPTPKAETGHDLPTIEECLVCFEPVTEAIVLYPCGHYVCDDCAARLLANSFHGIITTVRCPQCRMECPDENLVRVRLCDQSRTPAIASRVHSSMPTPAHRDHEPIPDSQGPSPPASPHHNGAMAVASDENVPVANP